MGLKGAHELKDHPWLKTYPWKELYNKSIPAPFIPKPGDNFDRKYCESQDIIGNSTMERYHKYVRDENFVYVFNNFTYINFDPREVEPKSPIQSSRSVNLEKQAPHTSRVVSSKPSKLATSASQKNYNFNLLKNNVNLVEAKVSLNATMKKPLPLKKVLTNSAMSFTNSYLTGMSKATNNNLASNNTNATNGKYTPTREKKVINPLLRSKSKGSTSDISSTYTRSKNASLVSSSSTNNLKNSSSSSSSNNKLPYIGYLEKIKLIKGLSGTSTSTILKHYRHNSISQSSTGSSVVSSFKFLNKL